MTHIENVINCFILKIINVIRLTSFNSFILEYFCIINSRSFLYPGQWNVLTHLYTHVLFSRYFLNRLKILAIQRSFIIEKWSLVTFHYSVSWTPFVMRTLIFFSSLHDLCIVLLHLIVGIFFLLSNTTCLSNILQYIIRYFI